MCVPSLFFAFRFCLRLDQIPRHSFGGGFARGTANDPRFNGSYLVQQSVENGEPIVRSLFPHTALDFVLG